MITALLIGGLCWTAILLPALADTLRQQRRRARASKPYDPWGAIPVRTLPVIPLSPRDTPTIKYARRDG